ncbi:hypothetical protein VitviT2T_029050 [Vitis vinifera]|uniref:ADP-ribosyl cyclase/cyclic ADP-ribose hydrolase n=2 Tax=Vitis vinifera TaxID=29760 RepID=A0A438FY80_VITVI|nr:TMV resistance protein N [Vitis vinifera]WKA11563.1 hypothetical protein VitviT2T_029050 [Vitis vinifera]
MASMSMKRVSPSSHTIEYWRYDVLLSFRGEDTHDGFTHHLFKALGPKHIDTFKDDKLQRGEMIGSLLKTIEESRV